MLKMNYFKIVGLLVIVSLFTFAGNVHANLDSLPTMMVGQTTATDQEGSVSYGGMAGNYAVYNSDINSSYGFGIANLIGSGCNGAVALQASPLCFLLGTGVDGRGNAGLNKLMNSRTSVDIGNGSGLKTIYELPALFLGGINVVGDVFGDPNNFAFWGRNLAMNKDGAVNGGTGASWGLSNYATNPNAKITWGSAQFNNFTAKIQNLAQEATPLPDMNTGIHNWSLQSDVIESIGKYNEVNQYPEGKVWVYDGDLVLGTTSLTKITYYGVGTIIVKGDLDLQYAEIEPGIDPGYHHGLGFIVYGNVNVKCGSSVNAKIIALGSDQNVVSGGSFSAVGGSYDNTKNNDGYVSSHFCNNEFKGSFVARDFNGLNNSSDGVNFIYDPNFDDNQPPGFRDLNLSAPSEVGNK